MNKYPVGCNHYSFPSSLRTTVQINEWAGLGRENSLVNDETVPMRTKSVLFVCVCVYICINIYINKGISTYIHISICLHLYLPFTLCVSVWLSMSPFPCPSSYSRTEDNRQKVVHGKFQLDKMNKNTRKVVRHWNRGLKRWDQHPWRLEVSWTSS